MVTRPRFATLPQGERRSLLSKRLASRRALAMAAAAVVLAGFALRIFRLDYQSLWWDETYSVYMGRGSLGDITWSLWFDQVPLYYYLLWAWAHLVGHSEFAVRYLSLICGVLSLPLLYQLLRRRPLGWAAVAGSGLLAISAFHVYYSQEARMHALACLLGLAAAYTLIDALRRGDSRRWCLYALLAAALVYTFYYSALVLIAINLPILFDRDHRRLPWWLANAAVVLAWLPWLAMAYARFRRFLPQRMAGSSTPDFPHYLLRIAESFAFGATSNETLSAIPPLAAVFASALAVAFFVGAWMLLRKPDLWSRVLSSYALFPVIGTYLILLRIPVFATRYLLGSLPAAIALLAAGWSGAFAHRRFLRWFALPVLAALAAVTLFNNYASPSYARDDYRRAFALIREQSLPDEAIVYDTPFQYTALAQYYPNGPLPAFGLPVAADPARSQERLIGISSPGDEAATQAKLAEIASSYSGVWAVYFGEGTRWVEEWLDAHMLTVSDQWMGVSMRLKHYRLGPQPLSHALPDGVRIEKGFGPMRLRQLKVGEQEATHRLFVRQLWTVDGAVDADYRVSLQMFGADGRRVGQWDGPPLGDAWPTSRWTPEHSYDASATLPLPPPGLYTLKASVYDAQQRPAGKQQDVLRLARLAEASTQALNARTPAGWTVQSVTLGRAGDRGFVAVLDGLVDSRPALDYTWFVHLLDRNGKLIAQDDRPPLSPTSLWRAGDRFHEVFGLPVSPPPGSTIEIGAYEASGRRVVFHTSDGRQSDHVTLTLSSHEPIFAKP